MARPGTEVLKPWMVATFLSDTLKNEGINNNNNNGYRLLFGRLCSVFIFCFCSCGNPAR